MQFSHVYGSCTYPQVCGINHPGLFSATRLKCNISQTKSLGQEHWLLVERRKTTKKAQTCIAQTKLKIFHSRRDWQMWAMPLLNMSNRNCMDLILQKAKKKSSFFAIPGLHLQVVTVLSLIFSVSLLFHLLAIYFMITSYLVMTFGW